MGKQELWRLVYLVKFWQVRSEGKRVWRGALEDAHTGEKRAFGDPAGLLAFLQDKLATRLRPARPPRRMAKTSL